MIYTNQKTFGSLQVTPDLLTSTHDQFTSVIRHSTDTNDTVIAASTALSNSCKTHSEAVSLQYTIEYTNNNTLEIAQYKYRTWVLDSGISHRCHQNV